jgi:pimeloyl-ACP methyl ester carboxylesterase
MTLYGMDVESGRRLSEELARASDRLTALSRSLTPLIQGSPWKGADAQKFTDEWTGHRTKLISTAHALAAASNAVKRNVEEQVAASTRGTGGTSAPQAPSFPDSLLDSIAGTAGDLWDTAGRVTTTVQDAVGTAWNFVQDSAPLPIRNIMDAQGNVFSQTGNVTDMGWRWLTSGEPPSITELFSNGVLLAVAVDNLRATTFNLGLSNPHLLDDGRPVAGEPIPVGVGTPNDIDSNRRLVTPVPSTISAVLDATDTAYSDAGKSGVPDTGVRITTVEKPGEPPAYIVSIPGTTRWSPDGAANPTDLTGNLELAGGNLSTAAEAVRLAMEQAGIPEDAPVMLSGHSQGGMIAAALASDGSFTDRFNVTNLVTFGSPVDSSPIPPSIDVLALQHAGDPVPKVDLADSTAWPGGIVTATRDNGATIVELPNPDIDAGIAGINYHDAYRYVDSVSQYEAGGPIAHYSQQQSTQRFLTTDATQVTSTVTNVSRKQ